MIAPRNDLVLVRRLPRSSDLHIGGIVIPSTAQGEVGEAEVLAVGPGACGHLVYYRDATGRQLIRTEVVDKHRRRAVLRPLRRGVTRQPLDVAVGDHVLIGTLNCGTQVWPDHQPRRPGTDKHDFLIVSEEEWRVSVGEDVDPDQGVHLLAESDILLKFTNPEGVST